MERVYRRWRRDSGMVRATSIAQHASCSLPLWLPFAAASHRSSSDSRTSENECPQHPSATRRVSTIFLPHRAVLSLLLPGTFRWPTVCGFRKDEARYRKRRTGPTFITYCHKLTCTHTRGARSLGPGSRRSTFREWFRTNDCSVPIRPSRTVTGSRAAGVLISGLLTPRC